MSIPATLSVLSQVFGRRGEFELLLISITVSVLLTGLGRISIEWNVLKREIFPRGRTLVQNQKDAVEKM